MSEPKPERITEQVLEYLDREARITEQVLEYLDREARYPNVEAAISDVIRLVAEVRRLRALIVACGGDLTGSDGWCGLCGKDLSPSGAPHGEDCAAGGIEAEAEAIRAERCPTGTSSEKT
jgi:hypothetical protein